MSPANILNDADFAAAFRKVKAANHERRIGQDGRSVYMVPDNEMIPGRDDLNQVPVDEETKPDPDVVTDVRRALRKRDRNAPNRRIGTDPETAA